MKKFASVLAIATILSLPAMAENTGTGLGISTGVGVSADLQGGPAIGENLNGTDVRQIQQQLNARGYYSGNVDGIWGSSTADALRRFQTENNIEATGALNSSTIDQLDLKLSNTTRTSVDNVQKSRNTGRVGVGADADVSGRTDMTTGTSGRVGAAGNTSASGSMSGGTSGSAGAGD